MKHIAETQCAHAKSFGAKEALVAMIGFILIQAVIIGVIFVLWGFYVGLHAGLVAAQKHVPVNTILPQMMMTVENPGLGFRVGAGVIAYVLAALMVTWYVRCHAGDRLRSGDLSGLAWGPATSGWAYGWAVLLGLLLLLFVVFLLSVVPPTHLTVQQQGIFAGFDRPGWTRWVIILMAAVVAPVVEEFIFRGAGFAGLVGRVGPLGAGMIVTFIFMFAHAVSKMHYPLGFLFVALLSAGTLWLRIHYRSIWPGITMHALYNFCLIAAVGATHFL